MAGIRKYFFARDDSSGRSSCAFHHCSGLSVRGKGLRSLYLMSSSLASSLEDRAAALTSEASPNSWAIAAVFVILAGGSSEIHRNDFFSGCLPKVLRVSSYMLTPHCLKTHLLAHPGSEDQLSCCVDLYEQGLSAPRPSERVGGCLHPLLPRQNQCLKKSKERDD